MPWDFYGDWDEDPDPLEEFFALERAAQRRRQQEAQRRAWRQHQQQQLQLERQREAKRRQLWLQRQAEIEEERRQQQLQCRRQTWLLQQREAAEERRREEEEQRQERKAWVADFLVRYHQAFPPPPQPAAEGVDTSANDEVVDSTPEEPITEDVVEATEEVVKGVSQELAIVPPGNVLDVPSINLSCTLFRKTGFALEVVAPPVILSGGFAFPPTASVIPAAVPLHINDSIRGRIDAKWGRMMRIMMAFCGSNNDLDPGELSRPVRGRLMAKRVIIKRKKKAPPWLIEGGCKTTRVITRHPVTNSISIGVLDIEYP